MLGENGDQEFDSIEFGASTFVGNCSEQQFGPGRIVGLHFRQMERMPYEKSVLDNSVHGASFQYNNR